MYNKKLLCEQVWRLEFRELRTEGDDRDYVSVYDGSNDTSPELAHFSGAYNMTPDVIVSSGPYMFVVFYTDSSTTEKGFYAVYTADAG